MSGDVVRLRLSVVLEADADAVELDAETTQLRSELLELEIDAVERPPGGPPPEGARAAEVAILGTLLVEVSKGLVGSVVRFVEEWVRRRRTRSVELTLNGDSIKLSNVSDEDQRRLLETFLRRHGDSAG
jgi:hypothetical protein